MNAKQPSSWRPEKPKPSQLNKPLILVIFFILIVLLAIIIVSAFQSHRTHSIKTTLETSNIAATAPNLSNLPSDYTSNKVANYLPEQTNNDSQLAAQLTALQQSQSILEQKLALATQNNTNTMQTNEAIHSGLFFSGVAPDQSIMNPSKTNTQDQSKTPAGPNDVEPSDYERQNMQSQKINFIKTTAKDQSDIYNEHKMVKPISPYEVQAGTLIPAVLLTAVNTSVPGEIVARVRNDVYSSVTGQYLLIPQGSKLIGQYDSQVAYAQNRVLIVFNRIIRPDGSSILLSSAPSADLFGQSGAIGTVNNHWGRVIGSSVLSTILSVGAGATASNSFSNNNTLYPSSPENALLGGANGISQAGQEMVNKSLNIQPTLVIPTGYQFNIIVNKDMVLAPYLTFDTYPQQASTYIK